MGQTGPAFGELLRRLRTAGALSQEALAERAGLSRKGISDLERGARAAPRLETVRMLADALALPEPDRAALLTAARPVVLGAVSAGQARSAVWLVPAPLTRLIGRGAELTALAFAVRDPAMRLITSTGPGGVGKTRLAVAVAEVARDAFPAGVVFADLAPLAEPALVLPAVAGALGAQASPGQPLLETLEDFIGDKRLLLVLDNCEPVLAAAPDLAALLSRCPLLTVLATGREPWGVRGEQEFPLDPLPVPPAGGRLSPEEAGDSPAVALFAERARSAKPGFALTAENIPAVAAICRRLDGLPLAIELAAARVKILPPAALLARLEPRLPLLTGGGRDAPARQRTMHGAIAWSYDLLSAEEQKLFRRLAVFVGGFTLEAAEAVVLPGDGQSAVVLEGIASLRDKSLLREEDEAADEPRYRMLETIREFGAERLAESGEAAAVRATHAAYVLEFAEQIALLLRGPDARAHLSALERDHGNLRSALAWFAERGDGESLLRLTAALGYFWTVSGHWTEGNAWQKRALTADPRPSPARLEALENLGDSAGYQGDVARAEAALVEGLALARELGAMPKVSSMLLTLGTIRIDQGRYEDGATLLEEAMATARAAGDSYGEILALAHLGAVAWGQGDTAQAVETLETARVWARSAGHPLPAAVASRYLGLVAVDAGDGRGAAEGQRDWVAYDPLAPHILARTAPDVASLAARLGEPELAARLFGAAAALATAIGLAPSWPERGLHERSAARARGALGDDAFATAFENGRDLSPEQVLAAVEAVLNAADAATPGHARSGSTPPDRPGSETAYLSRPC